MCLLYDNHKRNITQQGSAKNVRYLFVFKNVIVLPSGMIDALLLWERHGLPNRHMKQDLKVKEEDQKEVVYPGEGESVSVETGDIQCVYFIQLHVRSFHSKSWL